MTGEAWSCFARLPPGLIDPSALLTLNWLRPKPTLAGFQLTRDDIDEAAFHRNLRLQRQAKFAAWFLALGVTATVAANLLLEFALFADQRALFTGVWAATTCFMLAVLLYALCGVPIMRFRRAEPRRDAFAAAVAEFAEVDDWRATRCAPAFWSETLDEAGFELEAAELIAGRLKTGQVALTRATNDYGVAVLACSPIGRVVAQCKQGKDRRIHAGQVRELAGSKAFFGADHGLLISLNGPDKRRRAMRRLRARPGARAVGPGAHRRHRPGLARERKRRALTPSARLCWAASREM